MRKKNARKADPWSSDEELVEQILDGDRASFDLLYETYFPRVYRFALKRLGDPGEAEDVTQDVFITVHRVLDSWAGNSSLLVWIFGITRNTVNRRFRKPRPRLDSVEDAATEVPSREPLADEIAEARQVLERCDTVIREKLTPLQRRIFHLKHLRHQPIKSIAAALGKSEDAVKANLYRMRNSLLAGAPGLKGIVR
ncbi:MAG: RNA polymerase sigma factor [Myxococcales bacterium]|nr:RNA polymerase sigma factor [Myxococcales bacterium]